MNINMELLKKIYDASLGNYDVDGVSTSGVICSVIEKKFSKEDIDILLNEGLISKCSLGYYITKKGSNLMDRKHLYRKRPVEIRAFQMTQFYRDNPDLWPEWLKSVQNRFLKIKGEMYIETLEGKMKLPVDNWVIEGVHGEIYSCDPEIFEKTYEKVEE